MALRVWLPLNGTLDNIGISDVTVTNNGATVDNNGKIGKCYGFNSNYIAITNLPLSSFSTEASLTAWIKLPTTHSAWAQVLTVGTQGTSWNNIIFGIDINGNGIPIASISTTSAYTNCNSNIAIKDDIWHHLVTTYKSGEIKIYIDGILKNIVTTSNIPAWNSVTNFYIGGNAGGEKASNGTYMNDVRLYNHCLSAKEVKEISQGLVLHYKLDGFSGGANENLTPCGGTYTRTSPWTTTKTAADGWAFIPNSAFEAKSSTSYTISVECDGTLSDRHAAGSIAIIDKPWSFWAYVCNTDTTKSWTTGGYDRAINLTSANNNYRKIGNRHVWTITLSSTEKYLSLRTNSYSDGSTSVTINWWNIKVEEGTNATDWIQPLADLGIDTTKITDSSGYGNDGIIVGTLATQQNSPRYSISTSFAASSAINCGRGAMVTDSITVNLWAKYSSYSNLVSCTEGGGWNFENNSGLTFPIYIASIGYVHIDAANRPPVANYANSWHMFTGVYDRLNKLTKLYIDGELIGTGTVSSPNLIQYHTSNVIWLNAEATGSNETASYGNAKSFSDFRIYATALSADDILDLYHTPANIDNLQNIHAFELKEQSGNMFAGSPMTGTVTWDATNNYYTITSNPSTSTWGIGPAVGTSPKKIIPWGMSYILTYEVYSPTAAQWYIDYNNNDPTTSLSGNDNDNSRLRTGVNVPANTWTLITYGCSNTNEAKNPDHLPLYDYSTGLGPVMTNISEAITWHMRNPQWYLVDADNKEHIYESGVFQANFIKEDSQSPYTSFRNEEKAAWAHGFIEK